MFSPNARLPPQGELHKQEFIWSVVLVARIFALRGFVRCISKAQSDVHLFNWRTDNVPR